MWVFPGFFWPRNAALQEQALGSIPPCKYWVYVQWSLQELILCNLHHWSLVEKSASADYIRFPRSIRLDKRELILLSFAAIQCQPHGKRWDISGDLIC